jgi:L-iditol 2-dehydrogenase
VGSYLNPLTHGRAVELVASGRLQLEPLITHRLTLDEVPDAVANGPRSGEVKAMFVA